MGGGGSVSRSHILQSVNNSQASNSDVQQQQKELRQIYQRKNKPTTKPLGSRGNRNISGGGVNVGESSTEMIGDGPAVTAGGDNNYE